MRLNIKTLNLSQESRGTNFFTIIGDNLDFRPLYGGVTATRSVEVDVRNMSELFLSFVVSKSGSSWDIDIDQVQCDDDDDEDEEEVEEEIESLTELNRICGRKDSVRSRQPRSVSLSLKRFIRKEIDKRKAKSRTLIRSEERSLRLEDSSKYIRGRKSKLLFGRSLQKYFICF